MKTYIFRKWLKVVSAAAVFTFFIPWISRANNAVDPKELEYESRLEELRHDLDKAQSIWEESIDDQVSDAELKRN